MVILSHFNKDNREETTASEYEKRHVQVHRFKCLFCSQLHSVLWSQPGKLIASHVRKWKKGQKAVKSLLRPRQKQA